MNHTILPTGQKDGMTRTLSIPEGTTMDQSAFRFRNDQQKHCIAGNIRWCKISDIWPKAHTIPRPCRSPMAYSTAWWSCSRFMKLYSFHFDRMTDQESLVGHSKIWQNTSCLYPIFTTHSEVKVQANFSIVQIFSFYFCMQNAHAKCAKISTIWKFPAIR